MKNIITYKGGLIAKNSDAYKLWEEKRFKELDKHLAEVARRAQELVERVSK